MPFSTDRGLRRRLVFTLPVQLDREMRRLAFELDQSPGKTTVSSYVEHCIREQMKRDAQEVRKRASLDSRFAGKAVPRTGYVELAERVARGLPAHCENGAQLYDGRCDPRRADECERDKVNTIDGIGHVFGMEGPQSIGPTWCARCGAPQEITAPGTTGNVTVRTGAEALAAGMPFERDPPEDVPEQKHAAQMADLEDSDEPIV